MARYVRRYKRRKTYRKKKSTSTTWKTAMQVAQQAYAGVKAIRSIVNSERHYTDTTPLITGSISTTGLAGDLFDIATGDQNNQRTGLSILAKTISVKGYVDFGTSNAASRLHILIVKDLRQQAGITPTYNDIYPGGINNFISIALAGRFKIVYSKIYNNDTEIDRKHVNIYLRINDHIRFSNTGANDIIKNGYYLIVVSDQPTNQPTVGLNTRVSFYDN